MYYFYYIVSTGDSDFVGLVEDAVSFVEGVPDDARSAVHWSSRLDQGLKM